MKRQAPIEVRPPFASDKLKAGRSADLTRFSEHRWRVGFGKIHPLRVLATGLCLRTEAFRVQLCVLQTSEIAHHVRSNQHCEAG